MVFVMAGVSVAGLVQSEAHASVARELSAARGLVVDGVPGAVELVAEVKVRYRKALQEYIDPFKVYRQW